MSAPTLQPDNNRSAQQGFLPDFCTARPVFLVILVAELLACILALMAGATLGDFWSELALISLFIQWVALGSVAILCYTQGWLNRLDVRAASLIAYIVPLVMTLLVSALALWGGQYTRALAFPVNLPAGEFLARNIAISAMVSVVVFRYFYVQHQWQLNVQAEARARLHALQAKMRPHFLFNSMNTIASLTRSRPELAQKTVIDLAELLRATLESRERIPLAQEVELTRRYLDIEASRLEERLKVDWQIQEGLALDTEVPALILQPLAENAIYHGIEPQVEGGRVQIRIEGDEQTLRICISNPLPAHRSESSRKGNRMALDNLRQRLALAFGEKGKLEVQAADNNYSVVLIIPRTPAS